MRRATGGSLSSTMRKLSTSPRASGRLLSSTSIEMVVETVAAVPRLSGTRGRVTGMALGTGAASWVSAPPPRAEGGSGAGKGLC
ncbi:MAG: hypothetical protein ACKOEI_00390 [Chthoniobacterales bacterium]